MKNKLRKYLLFVFVIILPICVGMQSFLHKPKVYDWGDYRNLTTQVNTSTLFSKENNVEDFLRDQLFFGNVATSIDRNFQYIFRGKIRNQVIIGKDQQLYLGNEYGEIVDNIRGTWATDKDASKNVRENVRKLNAVSQNLAKEGREFILIVAPSKESVYREELPTWYTRKSKSVADYFKTEAKFELIDLRPPLRNAKLDGVKVFYTNGTHWNHLGAYLGMKYLHESNPNVFINSLTPISEFRKLNENPKNVQLSRNLGQEFPGFDPETRLWQMMKLSPLRDNVRETDFVYQNLNPKWSLCSKLSTADFSTCRKNVALPTAVIFHDSFAEYAQQFLSEYFSKGRYVWGVGVNSRMIKESSPDLVVLMVIERALLAPLGISDDLLR
jgi:hypothetical protein